MHPCTPLRVSIAQESVHLLMHTYLRLCVTTHPGIVGEGACVSVCLCVYGSSGHRSWLVLWRNIFHITLFLAESVCAKCFVGGSTSIIRVVADVQQYLPVYVDACTSIIICVCVRVCVFSWTFIGVLRCTQVWSLSAFHPLPDQRLQHRQGGWSHCGGALWVL